MSETISPPTAPVLNIAAYLFAGIDDPQALRTALLDNAAARQLKGTILLAPEGINLFLAGAADDVRGFVAELRADARFETLETKESWSAAQPFRRLLVKVKREIIRMDHPAINPAAGRAPGVTPTTLKRWLDQGHDDAGKPIVLLDTRNAFEVDHGTFEGAIDWRIEKFTEFPPALIAHREELAGKTVVSFCTGGIRCEKAAILMREAGVEDVLQLEGGILKYFEDVGGAHYRGDCFVFDGRRTLAPDLTATGGDASAWAAEDPDFSNKHRIEREAARKLALLGGSSPDLLQVPRRRSAPFSDTDG